jgi:hypothetical protein
MNMHAGRLCTFQRSRFLDFKRDKIPQLKSQDISSWTRAAPTRPAEKKYEKQKTITV